MSLYITQVDAFTDKPFGGNPAAVCILDASRFPQHMRAGEGRMTTEVDLDRRSEPA